MHMSKGRPPSGNCESYEDFLRRLFEQIEFVFPDKNILNNLVENVLTGKSIFCEKKGELSDVLCANYIREIWIAECPPPLDAKTVDIVDDMVEGKFESMQCLSEQHKTIICNLLSAVKKFIIQTDDTPFTVETAKEVHFAVMEGLVVNAGEFRTNKVSAMSSRVIYAAPNTITERVTALFSAVNRWMTDPLVNAITLTNEGGEHCLLYVLRVATLFFSEFLLIHPFTDGNGRTARILLNVLVQKHVVVPFSLYLTNRDEYINVLEQRNNHSPPSALASYILLCCNRTAADVRWLSLSCSNEQDKENSEMLTSK